METVTTVAAGEVLPEVPPAGGHAAAGAQGFGPHRAGVPPDGTTPTVARFDIDPAAIDFAPPPTR
jgi:hypothetical protein